MRRAALSLATRCLRVRVRRKVAATTTIGAHPKPHEDGCLVIHVLVMADEGEEEEHRAQHCAHKCPRPHAPLALEHPRERAALDTATRVRVHRAPLAVGARARRTLPSKRPGERAAPLLRALYSVGVFYRYICGTLCCGDPRAKARGGGRFCVLMGPGYVPHIVVVGCVGNFLPSIETNPQIISEMVDFTPDNC